MFRSFLRKQKKQVQRLEFPDIQAKNVSHPYPPANRRYGSWSQSAAILNFGESTTVGIYRIRSTYDVTFDLREDDWERGWDVDKITSEICKF